MTTNENSINAFKDDVLGNKDATEIGELVNSKAISAKEVVEAAIKRIEEVNPILNAVATPNYEAALANANQSKGVFSGVPIFFKDQIDVKGLPTLHGSRSIPNRKCKKNDKSVDQILSTGVVNLGKSTSSEFGVLPSGETLLQGNTLNPINKDYSTGGSSTGSAALVASGVVPISHAMDGGGSIRIPASCCGLIGLKPTRGRHISSLTSLFPIDFAEQGIVSRSVRDTANYFYAVEKYFKNPALPAIGKVTHPNKKRLKIGVYTDTIGGVNGDTEVAAAALDAAKLCEELGHSVQLMSNPFDMQFKLDFTTLYSYVSFLTKNFGTKEFGLKYRPSKFEPFTKYFANMFPALLAMNPLAFKRLKNFEQVYNALFNDYDILLCPTIGIGVPKIGYWRPDEDVKVTGYKVANYLNSTIVQNISGAPAISLPMGKDSNGLPIGVQFATKSGAERTLLELAFELEAAGGLQPFLDAKHRVKVSLGN